MNLNTVTIFVPTHIYEMELCKAVPTLKPIGETHACQKILVIARWRGTPIGTLIIETDGDAMVTKDLEELVYSRLKTDTKLAYPEPTGDWEAENQLSGSDKHLNASSSDSVAISVVIGTRDRPDKLRQTLLTLIEQDYSSYEIIIVDNASKTEATSDLIKNEFSAYPFIRYVCESTPGLSVARNRGLTQARGDIVAFTDDDVLVDRQWLSAIERGFHRHHDIMCVTGLILPAELETQSQVWLEEFGGFSRGFKARLYDLDSNRVRMPLYPYTAGLFGSGANIAFRTDYLRQIGGFDTRLGTGSLAFGGEDLAICFSTVNAGYKLQYEPSVMVYHYHPRDYKILKRQMFAYGVGLSAYITWCFFRSPKNALEIIIRIPYGLYYAFSKQSAKNSKKGKTFPSELTRQEIKGMLYGPFAFFRSWLHDHHRKKKIS